MVTVISLHNIGIQCILNFSYKKILPLTTGERGSKRERERGEWERERGGNCKRDSGREKERVRERESEREKRRTQFYCTCSWLLLAWPRSAVFLMKVVMILGRGNIDGAATPLWCQAWRCVRLGWTYPCILLSISWSEEIIIIIILTF